MAVALEGERVSLKSLHFQPLSATHNDIQAANARLAEERA
jgi:hypothetical protein